ncbi:hypothetical protein KW516_19215 [Vibrio fluvialis]|nr:hypothetical protein [Vibrio fluvialis]
MQNEPKTDNFPVSELRCKCSKCKGEQPNKCNLTSLARLQRVRDRFYAEFGYGLPLSSAYRCLNHPEEQAKVKKYGPTYKGGRHVSGTAFDVKIGWGHPRQRLVQIAMEEGFLGFGYANSFLHIDDGRTELTSWGY